MESYEEARKKKDSFTGLSRKDKSKKITWILLGELSMCLLLAVNLYMGIFHDVLLSRAGPLRKSEDPETFLNGLWLVGASLIVFTCHAFWYFKINRDIHLR